MKGYQCPGCGKWIGLIFDDARPGDKPGRYRCPHTRTSMIRTGQLVHGPQLPIKRNTPKKTPVYDQPVAVIRKPIMPEEPV